MITTCVKCDGDGRTPSNAYREYIKCPDEFLDEFNKSHPDESCRSCSGVGHRGYNDEEAYFNALADKYIRETMVLSFEAKDHPSYVKIILMGKKAIPWILKRMQVEDSMIFSLLKYLVEEKDIPITECMRGKIRLIQHAWLEWGKREGHIE